jgi:hypothetical protein
MRRLATMLVVVLTAAVLASTASAAGSARPRVTLFGDSVAAALTYPGKARTTLAKGLDLRIDAKVCRRLAETGCPYNCDRPPSVLALVEGAESLGDLVVVDVGYNDVPSDYGADIDRVMQSVVRRGVTTVIWVTMQETRPLYRTTNGAIRAAAARWPQIRIADWHAASRAQRSWFAGDGLHLSRSGALALARFLRPLVVAWSCTAACQRERRIADTAA